MPLTIVGSKFNDIYEQVESQKAKAQLKTAQLNFEMKKKERHRKVMPLQKDMTEEERQAALKAFKLGHVITLKRWVYRTKKKLEVQQLSDEERDKIIDYLKHCRKICGLSKFVRQELVEFQKRHKMLMLV